MHLAGAMKAPKAPSTGKADPGSRPLRGGQTPVSGGHCLGGQAASGRVSAFLCRQSDLSYYRYTGSLTTPPCTEAVRWNVLKQPMELSADQLAQFRVLYAHNVRPVQPLSGRRIVVGE